MPRKTRLPRNIFPFISNNNLSYLMVAVCNFLWVSGFIYGNEHNMSFVQSQLSRYIMQAIITYTICKIMKYDIQFRSAYEFQVLGIRSLIFTAQSFVLCWSQLYLPLYVAHTISAIGPIFVCLLNLIIYKKMISSEQVVGMLIAFTGIILTVNGRLFMSMIDPNYKFITDFSNYRSEDPVVLLVVSAILMLFTILWAYAILITKKNQHHIVEVVYHQAIFGIIGASIGYQFLQVKTPLNIFAESFIWIGLVLGGGFTMFNIGLSISENTGICSIVGQFTVIVGYGYSVFRYGEPVNIICIIGTVLLIYGVFKVIFKKAEAPKPIMISEATSTTGLPGSLKYNYQKDSFDMF